MDIKIGAGTYIVAVSGGVDSMVLLDLLTKRARAWDGQRPIRLIVAHYDHGIRGDSKKDRQFVWHQAKTQGLPFVYDEGRLGPDTSEANARAARYQFLEAVRAAANARAIITAHHQDDQLETAFINNLRGTGRRGLTALSSRPTLIRPLLKMPKSELRTYAKEHDITWREDVTNNDPRYLRNHIRLYVLPKLPPAERDKLVDGLWELSELNNQIDQRLINYLHTQPVTGELDRQWFIMLPHVVATEVMVTWLREHGVANLDRKRVEMLTTKAKVLKPGREIIVDSTHSLKVGPQRLALTLLER